MKKSTHVILGLVLIIIALGFVGWLYYKNFYKFGTIMGSLAYPSEGNPAQQVCAINIQNSNLKFCINTNGGQDKFILKVPEGEYYVYASLEKQMGDIRSTYKAYYNQFVLCDLNISCDDNFHHNNLIPVKVWNGKTIENINPYDWYDREKLREQ